MVFEHDGTKLYYEMAGEGAPLLLLHGWGGSWRSLEPLVQDFSSTRRVVAVDFPGHGKSSEPPVPWSVTEYADLILALIDALNMRGADVVAHSFGCRVAILIAATHPEAVGRLALTGAAGIPPKTTGKKSAKSRVYRLLRGAADNALTRKLCPRAVDAWREALIQRFGSPDYRVLSPAMRQTFNRVIAQDLTEYLPRIRAATLLLWGTEDRETPLWMGQMMEKSIPDAALIPFEGAGHFAYLEQYPKFRAILTNFLAV